MELNKEDNPEEIKDPIVTLDNQIKAAEKKRQTKEDRGKVKIYIAFGLAIVSFAVGGYFFYDGIRESQDPYLPLSLNELGDYLGGTVASLWSLAGILIIYTSFVSQQIELGYTRVEHLRGRQHLQIVQKEVLLQQELNERQLRAKDEESFKNQIETLLDGVKEEIDDYIYVRHYRGNEGFQMYLQNFQTSYPGYDSPSDVIKQNKEVFAVVKKSLETLEKIKNSKYPKSGYLDICNARLGSSVKGMLFYAVYFELAPSLSEFLRGNYFFEELEHRMKFENFELEKFKKGIKWDEDYPPTDPQPED